MSRNENLRCIGIEHGFDTRHIFARVAADVRHQYIGAVARKAFSLF